MDKELVFVYGTLRRGRYNNYLLNRADYIGMGETVNKYAMYSQRIPYVTEEEPITTIVGELYSVSKNLLITLDHLEQHPRWYKRKKVEIKQEDGGLVRAWLYFNNNPQGTLIITGDFLQPERG